MAEQPSVLSSWKDIANTSARASERSSAGNESEACPCVDLMVTLASSFALSR
jgi:hypothetical protein